MIGKVKEVTFEELVRSKNDINIARYFINHTKKIILCTKNEGSKSTIYLYDEKFNYYKCISPMDLARLMCEEYEELLNEAIAKEKQDKTIKEITKLKDRIGSAKVMKEYVNLMLVYLQDKDFDNKKDPKHLFNFRNGCVDLRTGDFRERNSLDYVTEILDYDYNEERDKKKMLEILFTHAHTFNDEEETLQMGLGFLGYCLTGECEEQKALLLLGTEASNGKSTLLKIFKKCFPIYCKQIDNKSFDMENKTFHKTKSELKNKRLVYIEELDCHRLNTSALKSFIDGGSDDDNQVLYSTTEKINIFCKLIVCSNKVPNFDTDKGVERRFLSINLRNKFVKAEELEQLKKKSSNTGSNYYCRDKYLEKKFDNDEMKLAFFHILLPYAIDYYQKGLTIDTRYEKLWCDICEENNTIVPFIESHYEITGDPNDKVSKEEFTRFYNLINKTKLKWISILSLINGVTITDGKNVVVYKKDARKNGVRGCLLGLKEKVNIDFGEEEIQGNINKEEKENVDLNLPFKKITNHMEYLTKLVDKLVNINKDESQEQENKYLCLYCGSKSPCSSLNECIENVKRKNEERLKTSISLLKQFEKNEKELKERKVKKVMKAINDDTESDKELEKHNKKIWKKCEKMLLSMCNDDDNYDEENECYVIDIND